MVVSGNCDHYLRNVELSPCLDKGDGLLVNGSIATIRDEALGVLKLIVLVPHLSAVANHNRHGVVDDDVRRNVLNQKRNNTGCVSRYKGHTFRFRQSTQTKNVPSW